MSRVASPRPAAVQGRTGQSAVPHPCAARGSDRRQTRRFVWRERRSGFDRRRPGSAIAVVVDSSLIYLRDNATALVALLALANLLSVLDLVFTLHAFTLGAFEGNPLMRALFNWSTAAGAFVKIGLVAVISVVIWQLRRYRMVLKVAVLALTVFAAVVLYHCYTLVRL